MNIWRLGLVFLVIGLMSSAAVGTYITKTQDLQFYSVEDSTMAPVMMPGDLNISKKTYHNQLNVGDIISYQGVNGAATKRIRGIDAKTRAIMVAADNLDQTFETIQPSAVEAKSVRSIPILGYISQEFRRPVVLIGLVYIPVGLIVLREARHLVRATWRKPYNIGNQ